MPTQAAVAAVAADAGLPSVLVTRPEPGASETARRLAAMGFAAVLSPVMTVAARPLAGGQPQAVLVTSANALPGLPAALHATPLLAVGDATAAQARAAGFADVHSAGRDAAALAELACRLCRPQAGTLLLASGAGQGLALAADLRGRGFRVRRQIAYATQPAAGLAVAARMALDAGTLRTALFFSAESARVFMTLLHRDLSSRALRPVEALALSPSTAVPLRSAPWRRIRVAAHPNQDALLALLACRTDEAPSALQPMSAQT